jgi:hypothetical protein
LAFYVNARGFGLPGVVLLVLITQFLVPITHLPAAGVVPVLALYQ